MAINLVRKPSETPNISNYDDYRMFRYATGGYNGVVEKYGNECDYEIVGNTFKIKSGEIVIDGVQSNIDSVGVELTVDNVTGTEYYTVYCEVNLSLIDNQKSEIKATKNTVNYPVIEKGDDLTRNQTGIARLELYRLVVTNGIISNVVKIFKLVEVGTVKNSTNVTTNINGKAISSIFETNGTTAKTATYSTNSENSILEAGDTYSGLYKDSDLIIRSNNSNQLLPSKIALLVSNSAIGTISLLHSISTGNKIEIHFKISSNYYSGIVIVPDVSATNQVYISVAWHNPLASGLNLCSLNLKFTSTSMITTFSGGSTGSSQPTSADVTINKIYRVIE